MYGLFTGFSFFLSNYWLQNASASTTESASECKNGTLYKEKRKRKEKKMFLQKYAKVLKRLEKYANVCKS